MAAGKTIGEVLQTLEVSEATLSRWRNQYGGTKSDEAKRLKTLEEENQRLKKLIADQALDIQMLKEINKGN
jgi:transposase-like protein